MANEKQPKVRAIFTGSENAAPTIEQVVRMAESLTGRKVTEAEIAILRRLEAGEKVPREEMEAASKV